MLAALLFTGSVVGQAFQGFTSARLPYFNNHDDFQAYFVYPREMLDSGALTQDPFNERRISSSLGGQAFLHTLTLSLLSERNLNLIETGIGSVITLGLLIGLLRRVRAPPLGIVGICAVFLLAAPTPANISSQTIGLALLLTLFRTAIWLPPLEELRGATIVGIGLVGASVGAAKNSLIPALVLFLAAWLVAEWRHSTQRMKLLLAWLLSALFLFALVVPWMLALHRSSGTYFFPLFGKGYHGSQYGAFFSPLESLSLREAGRLVLDMATTVPFLATLGLFVFSRTRPMDPRLARMSGSLALAALGGSLVLAVVITFDLERFSYPLLLSAALVLLAALISEPVQLSSGQIRTVAVAALAAGLVIGAQWQTTRQHYEGLLRAVRDAPTGRPFVTTAERNRYRAMQEVVPPGETILTRLEKPFLLNFGRNHVYVVDWPGGASPPPGIPIGMGGEVVAAYLRAEGVRYVAYSYRAEGGFPKAAFAARLDDPPDSFNQVSTKQAFSFQDAIQEIAETRKHLYDDGEEYVLDLATKTDRENR